MKEKDKTNETNGKTCKINQMQIRMQKTDLLIYSWPKISKEKEKNNERKSKENETKEYEIRETVKDNKGSQS